MHMLNFRKIQISNSNAYDILEIQNAFIGQLSRISDLITYVMHFLCLTSEIVNDLYFLSMTGRLINYE